MANRRRPAPRREQQVHTDSRARDRLAVLAIVLAGFGVYANSLTGPFVFDDLRAIVSNQTIRQIWPPTSALQPPRQTPVAGRPLANFSFAVNFALGGLQVEGYHLLNITIHILAALALFGVLRRILGRMLVSRVRHSLTFSGRGIPVGGVAPPSNIPDILARRALPAGRRAPENLSLNVGLGTPAAEATASVDRVALLCALVWVVHPLNTDAVDYLTQRTESLMGLFYLLTLYASIRAWDAPRAEGWSVVAVVTNMCGIASKEAMVTVPFVLMLCDRVFAYPSFSAAFRARLWLYGALAAGWLLFVALAFQTPFFSATGFDRSVSRWTYMVNQAPALVGYFRLSFWPQGLVFDYGVTDPLSLRDVWPSALFVVGLLVSTIVALLRAPAFGFWGAWFFLTLAPASSVIPIPTEVAAERRMYLPLVAVVVVTILLGRRLGRYVMSRMGGAPTSPAVRLSPLALATTALVLLGVGTLARNREYQTGLGLWQTVLDRRPHPRAHTNIAVYFRDAGQVEESLRHLRIAAPDWPDARFPLGSALIERGDVTSGVAELEAFIRLRPDHAEVISAREELANAWLRLGNEDRALDELRTIVALAPHYARGHINLGNMLVSRKDFSGAAAEYREALEGNPDSPAVLPVLIGLGSVLAKGGHDDEAVSVLQRALRVDPANLTARRELLQPLFKERRFIELEAETRMLLSAAPHDADAHNQLGIALASQDRLDEAVEHFAEAVRLNPSLQSARNNLALAVEVRRRATVTPSRR